MRRIRTPLIALLAVVVSVSFRAQTAPPQKSEKEVVRGHVVAYVASLAFGAGLGPRWTKFIFSMEQPNGATKLVLIAYAFDRGSQLPPDSFWHYSNTYEMRVKRDPRCDASVQDVSYEKNFDTSGKELSPSFILQFTKDGPVQALDPALMLPCYVLWYSDYKQVQSAPTR